MVLSLIYVIDIFMRTLVKCRPPVNKIPSSLNRGKRGRYQVVSRTRKDVLALSGRCLQMFAI